MLDLSNPLELLLAMGAGAVVARISWPRIPWPRIRPLSWPRIELKIENKRLNGFHVSDVMVTYSGWRRAADQPGVEPDAEMAVYWTYKRKHK
jgi:hypothetical protein